MPRSDQGRSAASEQNGVTSPDVARRLELRQSPSSSAIGYQRWSELLFLHWKIDPRAIQATLPQGLFVDTYAGDAYLGLVPFFMQRIRPAWLPPLPWISWFLELNVRTYVHDAEGRPGVWFYSLDCSQPLAVALARRFFHLPYFHARMAAAHHRGVVHYECRRRAEAAPLSRYAWTPGRETGLAEPGSLAFFLVERYLLFAAERTGQLYTGRVHHAPYRLHTPELTDFSTAPARQAGFDLGGEPAPVLGAQAVDVAIFPLGRINAAIR